jgi:hypothetical protein
MPPIARNVIDAAGTALIDDWIASLTSCGSDPEPLAHVIDNGEPGTSATGGWSTSGGAGFYGVNSLYSKIAGSTYTYRFTLPQAGDYEVFLWWTEFSSRRSDVPVQVTHASGVATSTVDQRANGGQWNRIGSWSFGTSAVVRITALGGGLSTSADAVALIPAGGAPSDTIIDNGGPGTSSTGYWPASGAPDPYGTDSLYSKAANASYTYQVALPGPGTYDVYLWWTQWPSRLANVPVQVTHASGAANLTVDQRANGGQWNLIGTWSFGANATVKITSPGPGTTCADAVRFVPR